MFQKISDDKESEASEESATEDSDASFSKKKSKKVVVRNFLMRRYFFGKKKNSTVFVLRLTEILEKDHGYRRIRIWRRRRGRGTEEKVHQGSAATF